MAEGCPQLESVLIEGPNHMSDGAMEHLSKCQALRHVFFLACENFTDQAAKYLPQSTMTLASGSSFENAEWSVMNF